MRTLTVATLVGSLVGSAFADLTWINPAFGASRAIVTGISRDGSTLAINLHFSDGINAATWTNGQWDHLAALGRSNRVIDLSDDGLASLTVCYDPIKEINQLVYQRNGVRTLMDPNPDWIQSRGALSRDGMTVYFGQQTQEPKPRDQYFRWSGGVLQALSLNLGPDYTTQSIHGSDRDDFVVVTGYRPTNPTNQQRVTVYDSGMVAEVPLLSGQYDYVSSSVIGVNGEQRTIWGYDTFWETSAPSPSFRSWIYEAGVTREIRLDGVDNLQILAADSRGGTFVAQGAVEGVHSSFIFDADGRIRLAASLLSEHDFHLNSNHSVSLSGISGDGTLIAGQLIERIPGVSVTYSTFTLRIPAPGTLVLACLAGAVFGRGR